MSSIFVDDEGGVDALNRSSHRVAPPALAVD